MVQSEAVIKEVTRDQLQRFVCSGDVITLHRRLRPRTKHCTAFTTMWGLRQSSNPSLVAGRASRSRYMIHPPTRGEAVSHVSQCFSIENNMAMPYCIYPCIHQESFFQHLRSGCVLSSFCMYNPKSEPPRVGRLCVHA